MWFSGEVSQTPCRTNQRGINSLDDTGANSLGVGTRKALVELGLDHEHPTHAFHLGNPRRELSRSALIYLVSRSEVPQRR